MNTDLQIRAQELMSLADTVLGEYGTKDDYTSTYCDDRLRIHTEPQGMTISLHTEVGPIVLQGDDNEAAVYRPGRWESYLEELADKAAQEHDLRIERERNDQDRRRRHAFAPIDDSALFPEYFERPAQC